MLSMSMSLSSSDGKTSTASALRYRNSTTHRIRIAYVLSISSAGPVAESVGACAVSQSVHGWLVGWRSVAAATNLGGPANKQNEWMLMFGRKTTEETIDNQYDMRHYSSTMTSFTQASGYIHPHYIQLRLHF